MGLRTKRNPLQQLLYWMLTAIVVQTTLPASGAVIVQIKVIDGEGAVYPTGSRATRGLTVLVTDDAGKPVEGATVSFRLPDEGAGGTFSSGLRTEVVTTSADGRAAVWGMQWNRSAGPFEIRVTAVKDQARAGIVCTQYLSNTPSPAIHAGGEGEFTAHHSHKWLIIGIIVASTAAGLFLAHEELSKTVTPGSTASNTLQIGSPSINIGHQ